MHFKSTNISNEKEFMDMLSYIAENKVPVIMESKVDIFVAEIILSYFPEEFNQKLRLKLNKQDFIEYFVKADYKLVNERFLFGYKLKDIDSDM